jgi:hypothetical protein
VELRQAPQHRAGVARAASEAGARGHPLDEGDARAAGDPGALEEGARRARREVPGVGRHLRASAREREVDAALRAQRDLDLVGQRTRRVEGQEQALEQVVAVGAPPDDAQPEVQLGRRGEAEAYREASTKRMRRS